MTVGFFLLQMTLDSDFIVSFGEAQLSTHSRKNACGAAVVKHSLESADKSLQHHIPSVTTRQNGI